MHDDLPSSSAETLHSPANSPLNSPRTISYLFFSIAAILTVLNVSHLWLQTSNPGETSNPESLFIYHALNFADGKPLYTDFRKPPFNVTQYAPVNYALLGMIKRSFDLSVPQLFKWGRRLTLLFALGIALLIFTVGKKETRAVVYPLIAGLVFLGSYMLWPLACTNRSDMAGAFFSIAAITVFVIRKNGMWLTIPLLLLAFYTKQSFVSAAASIVLYHLLQKQYSRFIKFSAIYGFCILAIWFLLHSATSGMSTLNLIGANVAPMSFRNVRLVAGMFLQTAALPLILSISGLDRRLKDHPFSIYFLFSLILGVLTSAKLGSSLNYFLEPFAAGCFLISAALKKNLESAQPARLILTAVFIVLSLPQISFLSHTLNSLQFRPDQSVLAFASQAEGLIITDSPKVALASRTPFLMDPFAYSYLESTGKWDSSELISMIKQGKVQYLILLSPLERPLTWQGTTRLPQSVIRTCSKLYQQTRMIDHHFVYEKR